jgi:tRNA dimethylallyltransferase
MSRSENPGAESGLERAADPLGGEPLVALVGVTASGKTELALGLAERLGREIVSLDSMLVYRGMDVGTAKPTPEERARVPHHLIDRVDPAEAYDARRYLLDVAQVCADLAGRGVRPLFVGGTGFYLKLLSDGLFEGPPVDPAVRAALEARGADEGWGQLHAELLEADPPSGRRIHPNDHKRVVRALEVLEQTGRPLSEWQAQWAAAEARPRPRCLLGLEPDPARYEARIAARIRGMLADGWIEEVRRIRDGAGFGASAIQALGYPELLAHLEEPGDEAALVDRIALKTRQFARRQRTWWRRFEDLAWAPAGLAGEDLVDWAAERVQAFEASLG